MTSSTRSSNFPIGPSYRSLRSGSVDVQFEEVAPLLNLYNDVGNYESIMPSSPSAEKYDEVVEPDVEVRIAEERKEENVDDGENSSQQGYRTGRVLALDMFRGLIMIFMSLDHARKYLSSVTTALLGGEELYNNHPTYQNSFSLFIVRFMTHLSAPGFFFLIGLGEVYFYESRKRVKFSNDKVWSNSRIIMHFAIRGAILVSLAATLFNDGIMFQNINPSNKDLDGVRLSLGVLYALGINMLIAILIILVIVAFALALSHRTSFSIDTSYRLSGIFLALVSVIISILSEFVVLHVTRGQSGIIHPALVLTFVPATNGFLQVLYPFIPWLSPTCWGIAYGLIFKSRRPVISSLVNLVLSVALLILFTLVRLGVFHNYGNIYSHFHSSPSSSSSQLIPASISNTYPTIISFFTITKYPPSLSFLSLTLALNHLFLALLYIIPILFSSPLVKLFLNPLVVYGQSSLFFYVTHVGLYFVFGVVVKKFLYPEGVGLVGLMPWWVLGLALLWVGCRWYGGMKHSKPKDSIWRLF